MITVEKEKLQSITERAARLCPTKSPQASLSLVYLNQETNRLVYEYGDGVTVIRGAITSVGALDEICCNVHDLSAKISAIRSKEIKIDCKKGRLILSDNSRLKLTQQALPGDHFSKSEFNHADHVTVPGGILRMLLSRVMFAAGTDETRAHMNAAEVVISGGKLKVTCTNGHAAAIGYADIDGSDSLTAIIPLSGCRALLASDADTFSIGSDANAIHVKAGNEDIRIRALADAFPPVQNVVDSVQPTACATVTASTLLDSIGAIRRAGDRSRVTVAITATELTLASEREDSQSDGTDTVSCVADKAGEFTVSADYLTGALKACVTPEIKFTAGDGGLDPILIQETGFTAVIMPIRR